MADIEYADGGLVAIPLGPRARAMSRRRITQQRRAQVREPDDDAMLGATDAEPEQTPEQIRARLSDLAGELGDAAGESLRGVEPAAPPEPPPEPPRGGIVDDDEPGAPASGLRSPQMALRAPMSGAPQTPTQQLRAPAVMGDLPPPDEDATGDDTLGARPIATKGGGWDPALAERAEAARLDAADRRQAERMRRAQLGIAIGGALVDTIGGIGFDRPGSTGGTALMRAASQMDSTAPLERIAERQRARDERDETDYRRTLDERRQANEDRRLAQAEAAVAQRAGYRDADVDASHPNAEQERDMYATAFSALPEHMRAALPGFNPANPAVRERMERMGATQLRQLEERLRWQVGERWPNARDWATTQRVGGGRSRDRGFLAPELGGTGGARTITRGDAGLTPEQLAGMDDGVTPGPSAGQRQAPRGGGGGGGRRQAPPQAQAPAGEAPEGRPVWDRPPTRAEVAANPRLAGHESLVRDFVRHMRPDLDLGNPQDRAIAASRVDDMSQNARAELAQRVAEASEREHTILMRDFEPRRWRRSVLGDLNGSLSGADRTTLMAALHGGPIMARAAGASQLRAQVADFMNNYFRETGGAAISDSEAERYRTALGNDSTVVDPGAFIAFIRRRMGELDREMDGLVTQYPDGWRRYVERARGARGR